MAAEIGSAYVRIRPNLTGFQAETESGVKRAFGGIAKVAAAAFAVVEGFEFGKKLVEGAADLQTQIGSIQAEFGKAGDAIIEFNQDGAAALGVTADQADKTAASLGTVIQSFGIGKEAAAGMTLNLEKLAGNFATIHNLNPAEVFAKLPSILQGNSRALRQLGITTNDAQVRQEALKLGLIDSVKQGLTPAQKAASLYAIAMQSFDRYQEQANLHSKDFSVQLGALKARLGNLGDEVGAKLIPPLGALIGFFNRELPTAIKITEVAFHDIAETASQFWAFVQPALQPVIDFIGRIRGDFAKGFKFGGVSGGLSGIVKDFEKLSPAAKVAAIAVGAVAIAVAALVVAAFPITAAILAVGGLAVAFQEAYKHSQTFRDIVGQIGDFITGKLLPAIGSIANAAAPAFAQLGETAVKVFGDIAQIIGAGVKVAQEIWSRFGDTITQIAKNTFDYVIAITQDFFRIVGGIWDVLAGVLTLNFGKAWGGLKDIAQAGLDAVITVAKTFGKNIEALFTGIWKNVELVMLEGISSVASLLAKIPTGVKIAGREIGGENPFKDWNDSLQNIIHGIGDARSQKDFADKVRKNVQKGLTGKLAGLDADQTLSQKTADTVGTNLKKTVAKATAAGFTDGLHTSLTGENTKKMLNKLADVLDSQLKAASASIKEQQDKIALIYDTQTAKLDAASAKLSLLQGKIGLRGDEENLRHLRQAILLPGGKQLSNDNAKAVNQLQALAKKAVEPNKDAILDFLDRFQSAIIQVAQDKIGLKSQKLGISRAALDTPLSLANERISVQQDVVDRIKGEIGASTDISKQSVGIQREILVQQRRQTKALEKLAPPGPAHRGEKAVVKNPGHQSQILRNITAG